MNRKTKVALKMHLLNPLLPQNTKHNGDPLYSELLERNSQIWSGTEVTPKDVQEMYDHLIATGQMILLNERAYLGKVLYENAIEVSDHANNIVDAVLADLKGRRGFRQVIDELESDVREELRNELASVVDEQIKKQTIAAYNAAGPGKIEASADAEVQSFVDAPEEGDEEDDDEDDGLGGLEDSF